MSGIETRAGDGAATPGTAQERPAAGERLELQPVAGGIADATELVPGWLERLAAVSWRVLVILAVGIVLASAAIVLATVTTSILVAVILAATFAPSVRRLRGWGWGRTAAAALVSVVAIVVIVLMAFLLAAGALPYVRDLVAAIHSAGESLGTALERAGIPPAVSAAVEGAVDRLPALVAEAVANLASPIVWFATVAILGGFLTFFLLQDGDRAWAWIVRPLRPWRAEAITASGWLAFDRVGGYLRRALGVGVSDATCDFVMFWLLAVPLPGTIAVLAFAGAFVPYVGVPLVALVAALLTFAARGPVGLLMYLVAFGAVKLAERRLIGRPPAREALDIHPGLVLVAMPIGAVLFGPVGLLAAMPVVALGVTVLPAVIFALDIGPEASMRRHDAVPVWLDRVAQWSWRSLVVAGFVGVVVAAAANISTVLLPVVIAAVLAATLDPVMQACRRAGWSASRAALVVTAASCGGLAALVVVTVASMSGPLHEMLDVTVDGAGRGALGSIGAADAARAIRSAVLSDFAGLLRSAATTSFVLLLATGLTFYLLRDGASAWARVLDHLDAGPRRPLEDVGGRTVEIIRSYVVGTGAISCFGAATTALLMLVLGLPLVLPIAILAVILGFIPYFGSFIATGLAFLVAAAAGDGNDVLIMAVYTIVMNIVQGNFVAPLVYGKAVNLHPAVVLLAAPAGAALGGTLGMFFIVPVLAVIAVTWRPVLHAIDPTDELVGAASVPAPGGEARASLGTAAVALDAVALEAVAAPPVRDRHVVTPRSAVSALPATHPEPNPLRRPPPAP